MKSNVFFVLDPTFALTCSPWRSPLYHLIYFLFETLLVITVFAKLNTRELKVTAKSPFTKSRNSSLADFYSFQLLFFFKVLCLLVCVIYFSMTLLCIIWLCFIALKCKYFTFQNLIGICSFYRILASYASRIVLKICFTQSRYICINLHYHQRIIIKSIPRSCHWQWHLECKVKMLVLQNLYRF